MQRNLMALVRARLPIFLFAIFLAAGALPALAAPVPLAGDVPVPVEKFVPAIRRCFP